jgi:protein phosphatase PTC7
LIPSRNAYNFDTETVDAIGMQKGNSYFERKVSRPESGEDAFFASKIGNSRNAVAFGIADGVGGWSESGVDPADFSHGFCTHMAQAALDWKQPAEKLRAVPLMEAGYDRALNDKLIPAGGSTASIGIGYEDGTVQLAK